MQPPSWAGVATLSLRPRPSIASASADARESIRHADAKEMGGRASSDSVRGPGHGLFAAARLYDAFDFVAYRAFEQRGEMLVHPFADERLDGIHEIGAVGVHPF